jgi:hypothetical protein
VHGVQRWGVRKNSARALSCAWSLQSHDFRLNGSNHIIYNMQETDTQLLFPRGGRGSATWDVAVHASPKWSVHKWTCLPIISTAYGQSKLWFQ